MKVALFFGTFNPIHIGHLIIGQAALQQAGVDKVWFVVSPSSPDKDYSKLLHEFDRFDLVREATRDNPDFKAIDIEFQLPKPSYTYLTIRKLKEENPECEFFILMGEDNFRNLSKWKNIEELRQNVRFIVYPREGQKVSNPDNELVAIISAPLINLSSTTLREMIKMEISPKYLIPEDALRLIRQKKFYQ
jgi:nicotinate-nucleotide adenylyltransferase